ncbi:MAG: hypothetical protein QOF57_1021 [Frankiaceae bacterium]|jgi:hypothetical protein|nr:hypothetical protein [Frankiaceae bacterium]
MSYASVIGAEAASVPLAELSGVWRRSLFVRGDGTTDRATSVTWLQSSSSYVDLRQPPRRPDMTGVTCLRDLTAPQLAWMATQEGFAGALRADAAYAEWERYVDMQPASPPDIGRLAWVGGVLLEEGIDRPYAEHWERDASPGATWGVRLVDPQTGTRGVIARVGDNFGYARGRDIRIGGPPATPARVAAAELTDAQDFLDCELAIGSVAAGVWTIERSSLPFREGADLGVALDGATCLTNDLTPDGAPRRINWRVVAIDPQS